MKTQDLLENLNKAIERNPDMKEIANYLPVNRPITDMWMEVSKALSNKKLKLLDKMLFCFV